MSFAGTLLLLWGLAPVLAIAAALAVVPFVEDADEREGVELLDR